MTGTPDTFDEEDRRLCPDDSCIGLIGENGRCKVCGRAAADGVGVPYREMAVPDAESESVSLSDELDGDDDDRRLCPNGACIGLLDETGRCKVCGEIYSPG